MDLDSLSLEVEQVIDLVVVLTFFLKSLWEYQDILLNPREMGRKRGEV